MAAQAGTNGASRMISFEAVNPDIMPFLKKIAGEDIFEKFCDDIHTVGFI